MKLQYLVILFATFIQVVVFNDSVANGQDHYSIFSVGLADLEHTSVTGRRFSAVTLVRQPDKYLLSGDQIVGYSTRFNGAGEAGSSAWIYTNGSIQRIGLIGGEYLSATGQAWSRATNGSLSQGLVYGRSISYLNGKENNHGWIAQNGTTQFAGLNDEDHINRFGQRYSIVSNHDFGGRVYGVARNFIAAGPGNSGQSAWKYDNGTFTDIGLAISGTVRNDGKRFSKILRINKSTGFVIGQATRFGENPNENLGINTWVHDGQQTWNAGLTDAEHTSSVGRQVSRLVDSSAERGVVGYSERFLGKARHGYSGWLCKNGTTTRIGLTDAIHTRSDGYQSTTVFGFIDNRGTLIRGISTWYSTAFNDSGTTSWLSDGTNLRTLGLTDNEHTRIDGRQHNDARLVRQRGKLIAGTARRFEQGSADLGTSVWIDDQGVTSIIGLTDQIHTRADGMKNSSLGGLSESGIAWGSSDRFLGGTDQLGNDSWIFRNGTTTQIGLVAGDYRSSTGAQNSLIHDVNSLGQATGRSAQYMNHETTQGFDAWYYDGQTTQAIGLHDSNHTNAQGAQNHVVNVMANLSQGVQVAGRAERFVTGGGNSAWLFDGNQTIQLGLINSQHTALSGEQDSRINDHNSLGQWIGVSTNYSKVNPLLKGSTSWIYDTEIDQFTAFDFAFRPDDVGMSVIDLFDDSGLLLGHYTKYKIDNTRLGDWAFLYSRELGTMELGELIDGGLTSAGWQSLSKTIINMGAERLVGYGITQDMQSGQVVFVMDRVLARHQIPEPSLWPVVVGLLFATNQIRRRRHVM